MQAEKRDFDKDAASWDEQPTRLKLASNVAEAILGSVELSPTMDALDFGCGTGLLTLELHPMLHAITGVDNSRGMLEVFRDKIARRNLGNVKALFFDLELGNSFPDEYDLIVSSMTLHHIKEVASLLKQFHDSLSSSGHLCIADLDLDEGKFHEDNTGVFHFGFDRTSLRQAFIEAGFVDIRDVPAAEVVKQVSSGEERVFTVFLMVGRKA